MGMEGEGGGGGVKCRGDGELEFDNFLFFSI